MEYLYKKLKDYASSGYYGFHMPGHKRNGSVTGADLPYEIDITEIEGFDDLHHADGLLKQAQERAASVYHAGETHYLINGSTVGMLSAVLGCTRRGGKILMARNCHRSVYNAVLLNELEPVYLYPELLRGTELNAQVLPEKAERLLEENPDIKVETQSVAFAEIKKQLSIGVAANELPDVTLCDTVDNVSFAAMGAAVDITEEVEAWGEIDNYYEAPRNSAYYEGKYYGLPYYSNCLAIMYNKDIFDEMGLEYPTSDWTWDDFKELVAETTTDQHYGLTMSLIKSEEGTFDVLPFIWQAGADWDSLDSEGAKEALTMINDFYQNGYMSKELISMTQADMCASLFATGKSAMMVAGSWLDTNIKMRIHLLEEEIS